MSDESRSGAKERSPNYPSIGLPSALELTRRLWQQEKRTPVPPEVAVQAMGYSGLSGASRPAIAALRQYGLVESGNGTIGVSDLAVDILVHEDGSAEWSEAVAAAATRPELFRELEKTYSHASDSAINAYLISKKRFSTEGARKAIKAFRETAALVNRTVGGYSQARDSVSTAQGDDMTLPSRQAVSQVTPEQKVTVLQVPLGGGVRAEIRFVGGDPEPAHIRTLEAYLKVAGEALSSST